jgi:putative ABC transport system permease protein
MLMNHLKVAWRLLLRNKGLSFINIFGLATGMAFAILIGIWIQYETSFDKFHVNKDRIGRVLKHTFFNNERNTQMATPLPLYYELKTAYPEVERVSRVSWSNEFSMSVGENKFRKTGQFVDPEFFDMFSFPIVRGNRKTALQDIHSIIITESLATTLFGDADPIGKTIRMNNDFDMKVSAVMKDIPKNSSYYMDFAGSFEYLMETIPFFKENKSNWGNNFLVNLVQLKEGVSMDAFSKKIENLNIEKDKTLKDLKLFIHPLMKWHLEGEYKNWQPTSGKMGYIRLFGMVGVFVLLIACINFMNLATARSEKRAREVGIRKAIGSTRRELVYQFMLETMLTSMFAFVIAICMVPLVLPLLKDLGFEDIKFELSNRSLLLSIFSVALLTGLVSGSYPALYLSSFAPVRVLKGVFRQGLGTVAFRKALVVSQFAISVGLIISTVIVFQQISHARKRSLGYDPSNLINVAGSRDLIKNFVPLKHELLKTGYLESVAKVSSPLTNIYNTWSDFSWTGKDPNAQQALDVIMTEWDFEKTAGLDFIAGRPFSPEFKTDSSAVILNEAALNMIGHKDPVGKTMKVDTTTLTIVGIVKDILIQNPFKPVNPTIIMCSPQNAENYIYLRLKKDADLKKALAHIQPVFEKYNPSYPFEFHFSDEQFARKFTLENQVGKLSAIFAGLAVFISCLGLFGLAAFMAERRTKEIGIRKVLGASVLQLWTLLSREFVWLVLAGCIIASPIAFWLMNDWLQGYDYRISISWTIFLVAGAVAVLIALLTVSTQAIRAAFANPVNSLRSE